MVQQVLHLTRNGVPYEEAWAMSDEERLGFCGALAELDRPRQA